MTPAHQAVPKCKHGAFAFERCPPCEREWHEARAAERRAVQDPAQALLDAYEARRPWWDVCAFCRPGPGYTKLVHEASCPFVLTLHAARVRHGLYLVDVAEGRRGHQVGKVLAMNALEPGRGHAWQSQRDGAGRVHR